jgi:tyrosyl-tRNA synthetase
MSKSMANYIGINESPDDIFGKLMSVSDTLMWRYFDLLSFKSTEEIVDLKTKVQDGANPRDIKFELAKEIVSRFHGGAAAGETAMSNFIARFQRSETPEDIPEIVVAAGAIPQVLKQAGLVASTSEAMRMIAAGGVRADGNKISDKGLSLSAGKIVVLQVGKRKFARVTVT